MSIIIHFGPSFHRSPMIPSAALDSTHSANATMGPGLENGSGFIMSADDSSVVDISTTTSQIYPEKESSFISTPQHSYGTCFGLPYQDHNYGAPPPPTPPYNSPQLSPEHTPTVVEPETVSIVTTVPSGEEVHEASVTRCICGFEHDDEYMICCDSCLVWQHVDCMGLNRSNIPDTYLCEQCEPRKVDRHKAKLLQAKKKVVLPEKLVFTETSEESEEDRCQNPDAVRSRLQRSAAKKRLDDDKEVKLELSPSKRVLKSSARLSQHGKDRMEIKRSKLFRRTKARSESSSAATLDEEIAQDAWKCSIEWPRKRLENNPLDNQYSDEVHSIAGTLKTRDEDVKVGSELQAQLCKVVEFGDHNKKLIAICDITRDQMIIEFKGQFMSSSLFYEKHPAFKQKFFPHVLFYKLRSSEELCVDATDYKTDAKYIRRSCQPNADVHHFFISGILHLHILSMREIKKDEEITIPFDVNYSEGAQDLCACNSDRCQFASDIKSLEVGEKKRVKRRLHTSTDDDSNQSIIGLSSQVKSPKSSAAKTTSPIKPSISPGSSYEQASEDQDTDDQSKEHKKKLTREERKLDAIMRAFDQMEKAAKRRQQALDRMAQQKALNPKSDETPEKAEPAVSKDEESATTTSTTTSTTTTTAGQPSGVSQPPTTSSVDSNPADKTSTTVEDEKSNSGPTKPKKGKRRRGSGTSTRKRSRTNSGGSDIFTADELSACESSMRASTSTPSSELSDAMSYTSSETAPSPVIPQLSTPTIFPKNKRFLHHEWLQDRLESTSIPSPSTWTAPSPPPPPLPIMHREVRYALLPAPPTCYVRCTRDGPRPEGISAAHLRRTSIVQAKVIFGLRSAKKRWLRQAMYDYDPDYDDDVSVVDVNDDIAPLHSICYSPHPQIEAGSPSSVLPFDDVVTPLKKRRLMRKSMELLSSPKSPNAESTCTSYAMSPDHSSCEPNADSSADGSAESAKNSDFVTSNSVAKYEPSGNGLDKHLLKSLREKWIMNDNMAKADDCEVQKASETGSNCVAENSTKAEIKNAGNDLEEKSELDTCNMETAEQVKEEQEVTQDHPLSSVAGDVVHHLTETSTCDESFVEKSETLQPDNCSKENSPAEEVLNCPTESSVVDDVSMSKENSGESVVVKSSDAQKDGSSQENCLSVHMLNIDDDIVSSVGKVLEAVSVGIECKPLEQKEIPVKATVLPAPQRRKVSLSEYRQRKRDNPNVKQDVVGGNDLNSLKPMEVAEGEVTLSTLPLFEKLESGKTENSGKSLKVQSNPSDNPEKKNDHRENLTDRLKREFGFEEIDKREGPKCSMVTAPLQRSSSVPSDISPILSLCAALPPPPLSAPIPPANTNGTLPTQFTYPSSIQQSSYVGAQIPPNQFIPILHPPPGCIFGGVPRPPFQNPGSQSFTPLPQQMPHMSSSYPPQFQSTVYK